MPEFAMMTCSGSQEGLEGVSISNSAVFSALLDYLLQFSDIVKAASILCPDRAGLRHSHCCNCLVLSMQLLLSAAECKQVLSNFNKVNYA